MANGTKNPWQPCIAVSQVIGLLACDTDLTLFFCFLFFYSATGPVLVYGKMTFILFSINLQVWNLVEV